MNNKFLQVQNCFLVNLINSIILIILLHGVFVFPSHPKSLVMTGESVQQCTLKVFTNVTTIQGFINLFSFRRVINANL